MGILSDLVPSEITDLLSGSLPQATAPDVSFKGFTVTGPSGGTITGLDTGGVTYSMGKTPKSLQSALESAALARFGTANVPATATQMGTIGGNLLTTGQQQLDVDPFGLADQKLAAQQAFGLGEQFMGQAGMARGPREQEVYDRIRATQLAEEERQRLALEERLASQGRLVYVQPCLVEHQSNLR